MAKGRSVTVTKDVTSPDQVACPTRPQNRDTDFPIVGIGCSAGGLEALDALLAHVPADSGMAFIACTLNG